jgi:hypothetical protein
MQLADAECLMGYVFNASEMNSHVGIVCERKLCAMSAVAEAEISPSP